MPSCVVAFSGSRIFALTVSWIVEVTVSEIRGRDSDFTAVARSIEPCDSDVATAASPTVAAAVFVGSVADADRHAWQRLPSRLGPSQLGQRQSELRLGLGAQSYRSALFFSSACSPA